MVRNGVKQPSRCRNGQNWPGRPCRAPFLSTSIPIFGLIGTFYGWCLGSCCLINCSEWLILALNAVRGLRSSLRNLCGDGDTVVMLNDAHHSIKKPGSTPRPPNFFYHALLHNYQTKASTLRVQEHLPFTTATSDPCSLILFVNHTFVVGDDHTTVHDTTDTLCSISSTFKAQHTFFAIRWACAPALLPGYVRCNVGLKGPPIRRFT